MLQYQYQRLIGNEIRLLHLEPGSPGDTLKCKLQHVSSASSVSYETISYCWGDTTRFYTIEAEGIDLAVPRGTADALLRFRDPDKVRTLWIDAVCINQDDEVERGTQIAQMHTIYACGTRNLIWIGEDDGTVADAIRVLNQVVEEIEDATESFRKFPMPGDADYYIHNRSGLRLEIDLEPLLSLCSRPWFGRLWVVQEAALAPTNICCCGTYSFDLTSFLRVARWLFMKRNFLDLAPFTGSEAALMRLGLMFKVVDQQLGYYQDARRKGFFQQNEMQKCVYSPTYWLLIGLQEFACRDPIDHVYGLLGLRQQLSGSIELPELLRPNLSASVSDVFRDATRQAILEGHSLASLCVVNHRVEASEDTLHLPSWVPQWHLSWVPDLDPHPFSRDYHASGDRQLNFERQAHQFTDEMRLDGILVNGLDGSRAEVVAQSNVESPDLSTYLDTAEELIRSYSRSQTLTDVEKTVAMVLCAGKNAATESATDDDLFGYSELKFALRSSIKTSPSPTSSGTNGVAPEGRAAAYDAASRRAYHRRRLFITINGRVGLGPPAMQRDDVVAILYGGPMPFILRRCGVEYKLVGPCYLYGIMDGEAVKEHEQRGDRDALICVR